MVNLGSSNTPVEGESFGLPAGAELTEDADGNLAIADSSGSIVLVRDETTGEWRFENTDVTGINAIDASSANVESLSTERAHFKKDPWHDIRSYGAEGDGTADNSEALQDAIDDADATGFPVYIPEGDFYFSEQLDLDGLSNVSIVGAGKDAILRQDDQTHNILPFTNCEWIKLRNFTLIGNGDTTEKQQAVKFEEGNKNCVVQNCKLVEFGGDAIVWNRDNDNIWALFNYIEDTHDDGINPGGSTGDVTRSTESFIIGNRIRDIKDTGIHVSANSKRTVVAGNIIDDCDTGIDFFRSSTSIVVNNTIRNCGLGIETAGDGGNTPLEFVNITNNTILDSGFIGIQIEHGQYINISNNIIRGSEHTAIDIRNNGEENNQHTVTDNLIGDAGTYGIALRDENTHSVCQGNRLIGSYGERAIWVNAEGSVVRENIAHNAAIGREEDETNTVVMDNVADFIDSGWDDSSEVRHNVIDGEFVESGVS